MTMGEYLAKFGSDLSAMALHDVSMETDHVGGTALRFILDSLFA